MPSSVQFEPDPGPIMEEHNPKPLDGNTDLWRCSCGETFESGEGCAICPRNSRRPPAARSEPPRAIPEPYHPRRGDAVEAWLIAWQKNISWEDALYDPLLYAIWHVLGGLIEDYQEHADMEKPLSDKIREEAPDERRIRKHDLPAGQGSVRYPYRSQADHEQGYRPGS